MKMFWERHLRNVIKLDITRAIQFGANMEAGEELLKGEKKSP